jgi:hypothetical protein
MFHVKHAHVCRSGFNYPNEWASYQYIRHDIDGTNLTDMFHVKHATISLAGQATVDHTGRTSATTQTAKV